MNDFSFGNFRDNERGEFYRTSRDINSGSDRKMFYAPSLHGEQFIDGQVYILKRKKPPTPYALFIKDRLPEMKAQNPNGDVGQFFKKLGREWHYMDSSEKCKYYLKYNDELKKYDILKHSIPRGVNPLLRVVYTDPEENMSTKRPKYSNNKYGQSNNYNQEEIDWNYQEQEEDEDDEEEKEVKFRRSRQVNNKNENADEELEENDSNQDDDNYDKTEEQNEDNPENEYNY
jgi:hypothetical protein